MSTALPLGLLPDTATIAADGSLYIGGCSMLDLAEHRSAHRCSSTTRAICATVAGRPSLHSASRTRCMRPRRSSARRWRGSRYDEGLLLDVATGGELHVALAAGVPAGACIVHGNNKSLDELRFALAAGVRPHRRRQLRRDGSPRPAAQRGVTGSARAAADHAWSARAHPRVHRDGTGRQQVRLQPRQR